MAQLTVHGVTQGAQAAMKQLQASITAVLEQQIAANRASVEGAQAAVIANTDLRASYDALMQQARASVAVTLAAQREKVASIEGEIAVIRVLQGEYKRGSAERQLLVTREIELQNALTAATGRAVGAAGVAAGRRGHARGAARRAEEGALRGGVSRGLGIGGALAGPGFILGAGGVIEAKAAIGAVKDMQVSVALLRQALTATGKAWNVYGEQILETVRKEEELSGFTRNELRSSMANLVRVTGDPAKSMHLLATAADVARARHIGLEQATKILVRTWATGGRGLARIGIESAKVTTHMDQLKNAHIKVTDANRAQVRALTHQAAALDKAATRTKSLDKIQQLYGGSAEKYMGTAAGATDKLHSAVEELQISIGRALLPQISHLAGGVANWIEKQQKAGTLQKTINGYIEEAGRVAHMFWEALKLLVSIIKPLVDGVGGLNNAIKLFIGYLVISKVAGFTAEMLLLAKSIRLVGLEAATAGAESGVAGLLSKLSVLAATAPITIPIILAASIAFGVKGDSAGASPKEFTNVDEQTVRAWLNNMDKHPAFRKWIDKWARAHGFGPGSGKTNAQLVESPAFQEAAQGFITSHSLTTPGTTLGTGNQGGRGGHGVQVASTANTGGRQINGHVIKFVERIAEIVGHPVKITTGTNHKENVSGTGRVSDHVSGDAADISAKGSYLVTLGQAALIAAGMNPAEAAKQKSFAGTVNGVNIIFNLVLREGGDHTDHLHVGLHSLPTGFAQDLTSGVHVVSPGRYTTDDVSFAESLASVKGKGGSGSSTAKPLRGMPTPGAGGGSVDKIAAKHGFRTMYGQTLINYIATKSKQLGLDPSSVLAVATVEGGFQGKVGDHGTSFGPFQLHAGGALPNNVWSQGAIYARAWANSAQGLDYALSKIASVAGGQKGVTAVTSIVSDFEHPADVPGEIAKASGRLGKTPFHAGRVQGVIPGVPGAADIRTKLVEQAKALRTLLTSAIQQPGTTVEDIFGSISSRRTSLSQLGVPVTAATQALIDKLAKLRARLDRLLKGGLVSKQAIASIRAQMKELGSAISARLSEQVIRSEHERSQLLDHVRQTVQRRQEAQLKDFDRATQAQISAMRSAFERQMREFDKVTQAGLKRFVVPQTGAEGALKAFQDQRAAAQQQQLAQQLQADLAKAVTGGDPQAVADAQKAIANMQLDEQEKALQIAADQSRVAQDILTQQQQDQYNEQRDNLKQSLQAREDQLEQSYQDSRDIVRRGMEDANTAELDQLNLNLEIWNSWLNEKAQSVMDFYSWLQQNYGVGPGGVGWQHSTPSIHLTDSEQKGLQDALASGASGAVSAFRINRNMAEGGTIRAPRFINRGDMIPAMLGHNETVISSDLTDALWAMVEGGGGSGVNVVVTGNTLLGRDRDVAREIATLTAPEIDRIISYRPML